MSQTHRVIISDTSCLIVLNNIGELELLHKLYGEILTTSIIADEFGDKLPTWVKIQNVQDIYRVRILELQIDKGESSAIALALEIPESTLILDDFKARKIAEGLGLKMTGTLGIIIKAKLNNLIPSVRPIFEKIKKTNFRISEEIELDAYKGMQLGFYLEGSVVNQLQDSPYWEQLKQWHLEQLGYNYEQAAEIWEELKPRIINKSRTTVERMIERIETKNSDQLDLF